MTLGALLIRGADEPIVEQPPIRGELFGATRLAKHARALARRHAIAPSGKSHWYNGKEPGPLLSRLDATEKALIVSRNALMRASAAGEEVSPAGAWLLDNFFIVLEQIPEIRTLLPPGYYRELPKLAGDGRSTHKIEGR
jgi:cyclic beta-1,2-glucan synthetase